MATHYFFALTNDSTFSFPFLPLNSRHFLPQNWKQMATPHSLCYSCSRMAYFFLPFPFFVPTKKSPNLLSLSFLLNCQPRCIFSFRLFIAKGCVSFMGSNQAVFLGHRVIGGGSRLSQAVAGIAELDEVARAVRRKLTATCCWWQVGYTKAMAYWR